MQERDKEIIIKGESVQVIPSHPLFDKVNDKMKYKYDSQLARMLGVKQPIISKIRHGKAPVSAAIMITIHKKVGLSILEIERLIAEGAKNEKID